MMGHIKIKQEKPIVFLVLLEPIQVPRDKFVLFVTLVNIQILQDFLIVMHVRQVTINQNLLMPLLVLHATQAGRRVLPDRELARNVTTVR